MIRGALLLSVLLVGMFASRGSLANGPATLTTSPNQVIPKVAESVDYGEVQQKIRESLLGARNRQCGEWWNPANSRGPGAIAGRTALGECNLYETWVYGDFQSISTLERVVVIGERINSSPWTTICQGAACWRVMQEFNAAIVQDMFPAINVAVREEIVGWFFPNKKLSACMWPVILGLPADSSYHPTKVTSHTGFGDQQMMVGRLMLEVIRVNGITDLGSVDITYSDGGTQTWTYTPLYPLSPRPKQNLKKGDGQSKCAA